MASNKKKNKKAGNIAERRKAKMEAMKFAGMVHSDLNKAHDIGMMKAAVIIMWMMHREHGFGRQRLIRMMNMIHQYCQDYIIPISEHGENEFAGVSVEDMCEALADECGIYIDIKKGRAYASKEAMEVDV